MDPHEFFETDDRVRALIALRKEQGDPTVVADDIKRTLCAKIHDLMTDGAGLRQRIVAVGDVDPELSAYISALESINGGIWCPKCKGVKSLGGGMRSVGAGGSGSGDSAGSDTAIETPIEVTRLQAHLESAQDALGLLLREHKQMQTQIDLLSVKLESYSVQLTNMRGGSRVYDDLMQKKMGIELDTDVPSVTVQSNLEKYISSAVSSKFAAVQEPVYPPIGMTVKKEDLPPMPNLHFDFTVPDDNISSDFLLE